MTVCIAALCDKAQACVVAADREITVGFPINIGFEHHERKIEALGKTCVVLSSGNALVAEEVISRTKRGVAGVAQDDVQRASAVLRDTYLDVHLERAEQVILRPRGITLKEFKDVGAQKIPLPIYQQIDQLLFNFTLNTDFLISGVDASGAHIGWVHYHGVQGGGWLESFDKLGYQAIGSGGSHANILLSLTGQHRDLSVAETVFNVYAAKVNAEVAPGVGHATDMAVITKSGTEFLTEKFIEELKEQREKVSAQRPALDDLNSFFSKRKEVQG
jgi:hypothetical protein